VIVKQMYYARKTRKDNRNDVQQGADYFQIGCLILSGRPDTGLGFRICMYDEFEAVFMY
jgi:hypothetical protein